MTPLHFASRQHSARPLPEPVAVWPILPWAMHTIHSPSPRCCPSGRRSPARRVFQHCYLTLQSTLVGFHGLGACTSSYCSVWEETPPALQWLILPASSSELSSKPISLAISRQLLIMIPDLTRIPISIGERPWPLFLLASLSRPAQFASE